MGTDERVGATDEVFLARQRIHVAGAVQGVGFRPFVYRQAKTLGLAGWVANSPQGVTIEAEGDCSRISMLVDALRRSPPANACVMRVECHDMAPQRETQFTVRPSEVGGPHTAQMLPDLATCADCLAELFDRSNRRYLYPFTNCTHCGPRYTIIEALPYDRARTSMRHFPMCPRCQAEYDDPADRRFHAEPNACPTCGPRLSLWDRAGNVLATDHRALIAAAQAIRSGQIVAVKGVGGFHLIADARDEPTVRRLRAGKQRPVKPFAVMFQDLEAIAACCLLEPAEAALLTSPACPIVLVRRADDGLGQSVAPGHPLLGVLLPYTPMHHVLMRELDFPVVATSGNVSDEPIVTDETEAQARLAEIADLWLVHNRPIVRPMDDSVARVVLGRELILRRARGFAPAPVQCEPMLPGILAVGSHFKATVALTRTGGATLSQHIGDLQSVAARTVHAQSVADLIELQAQPPRIVACDQHPDYASRLAAQALGRPLHSVQHHVAHIAACMADNGIGPPILGVAWDGTGYGPDGTIWGGEFILIEAAKWNRFAHLRCFRLPGGEAAAREPRRAALGLLFEAFGARALSMADLPPVAAFTASERQVLQRMLERGINAPLASSVGRLFDAFAALSGLCQRSSYEGEAAAQLEWASNGSATGQSYDFPLEEAGRGAPPIIDWQPALEAAIAELSAGEAIATVSERFHNGLAAAIVAVAERAGQRRVALTGGCFQNKRLAEASIMRLRDAGFEAVWHRRIPPNDGGIALGQAVWAGWCESVGGEPCA